MLVGKHLSAIFPGVVLVFNFDEFSKVVLHGHWPSQTKHFEQPISSKNVEL
jgi:hypothetical protein